MGPCVNLDGYRFLSTPSVWRATQWLPFNHSLILISIHALRVEGDHTHAVQQLGVAISIHALRVEGDCSPSTSCGAKCNFYPRPPCGGRRSVSVPDAFPVRISIHALRVEGDRRF